MTTEKWEEKSKMTFRTHLKQTEKDVTSKQPYVRSVLAGLRQQEWKGEEAKTLNDIVETLVDQSHDNHRDLETIDIDLSILQKERGKSKAQMIRLNTQIKHAADSPPKKEEEGGEEGGVRERQRIDMNLRTSTARSYLYFKGIFDTHTH